MLHSFLIVILLFVVMVGLMTYTSEPFLPYNPKPIPWNDFHYLNGFALLQHEEVRV